MAIKNVPPAQPPSGGAGYVGPPQPVGGPPTPIGGLGHQWANNVPPGITQAHGDYGNPNLPPAFERFYERWHNGPGFFGQGGVGHPGFLGPPQVAPPGNAGGGQAFLGPPQQAPPNKQGNGQGRKAMTLSGQIQPNKQGHRRKGFPPGAVENATSGLANPAKASWRGRHPRKPPVV